MIIAHSQDRRRCLGLLVPLQRYDSFRWTLDRCYEGFRRFAVFKSPLPHKVVTLLHVVDRATNGNVQGVRLE